jgi:NAD-dependent SIR2 family protein deacetylase
MYQFVGLPAERCGPEGDRVAWAYRIASVNWILNLPKHPVYGELLELVQNKDHFVISSNVDMFFEKNGFDPKRIWEPQGDWRTMQCLTPCRPDAYWPSQPTIDAILPQIDYENFVVPASAVPRCPHCGGKVSFNLRGGDWYIESTYHAPG